MAKGVPNPLFLFLLCILTVCSSGTEVGYFYEARKYSTFPSPTEVISSKVTPSQIRVLFSDHWRLNSKPKSNISVDLYLNKTQVEGLKNAKPSAILRFRTYLSTFPPQINIKNLIVSSSSSDSPGENYLLVLLSTLKSLHSVVTRFHLDREVKVSLLLSLPLLKNLNKRHEMDLHRILDFISATRSVLIVEATLQGGSSMGAEFVELVIRTAKEATAVLSSYDDASAILTIKSSAAIPSSREAAEFKDKVLASLENEGRVKRMIVGFFAEASIEEFEQKEFKGKEEEQRSHSFHRDLLSKIGYEANQRDSIYPPTTFPTSPITNNPTTTPVTVPTDNPSPTIVTIPSANPVTVTPSTLLTVPTTTSVPTPSTNPVNSPVSITNPATTPIINPGGQPETIPATTAPVTNPMTAPATANSPAVPGQSWCVAKSGAIEAALQAALDYACGMGGADCSAIQQGGSCYNPNTLLNHASYAFNGYYQKNPTQTSCDFGGTAIITNANPSTGSCVYPLPMSTSSTPATTTPIPATTSPTPVTTFPTPMTTFPTPTTTSSPGAGEPGSGYPPALLNGSYPDSVFGNIPAAVNSTSGLSTKLQPSFLACILLVTSSVAGKFV